MYRFIQKTIDWGVKIASLAITAPATWIVATQLFSDIQVPVLFYLMRFAAVFLIEGVLLSNWLLLEFDKTAAPEIKARYGITAMTMYAMLLIIAWKHEGPTGLVFRVALLAALVASGWDTYVYTWQRMTASIDRSPENAPKVKRHARNLSIKEAILRRESEHSAELALIKAQGNASLENNALYGQRLIANIRLDDRKEMQKLLEAEDILEASTNGKKKPLRQLQPPLRAMSEQETTDASYVDGSNHTSQLLRRNILDALGEDRNYSQRALAQKFGVDASEMEERLIELEQEGMIDRTGRHVALTEFGVFRTNGKNRARIKPR